jgi:hypothetical protein
LQEVGNLERLLIKEGLTMSERTLLEPDEGACGPVMFLLTATQSELEQEAEIMSINKPLKLNEEVLVSAHGAAANRSVDASGRACDPPGVLTLHRSLLGPPSPL